MRAEQLFSMTFLSFLLLLCAALTVEEAIHLVTNDPNYFDPSRTITHHPGCVPRGNSGRLFLCPVRGYGSAIFLCSAKGCAVKEPSTGLTITAREDALFHQFF